MTPVELFIGSYLSQECGWHFCWIHYLQVLISGFITHPAPTPTLPHFWKSLFFFFFFSKAEKRNTWDTTFSWCDPAKRLPGNGQPGRPGLSLERWEKQCSYPIQLQMNSVTPGKSLCSPPSTSGCTFIKWTEYFTVRYCKARYVELHSYYGNWESS